MKRIIALVEVTSLLLLMLILPACTGEGDNPDTTVSSTTTTVGHQVGETTTDAGQTVKTTTTAENDTTTADTGNITTGDSVPQKTTTTITTVTSTTFVNAEAAVAMQDIYDTGKKLGVSEAVLSKSLLAEGNMARVASVMKRAIKGENIRLGVIGGSVTQGSGSTAGNAYAQVMLNWWKKTFPQATFTLVNAGIGSTNSIAGAYRIQGDLLDYEPDLIVVEYAVNDGISTECGESYENVVRKAMNSGAAVVLLFLCHKNGTTCQSIQKQTGKHYQLPMISFVDSVYRTIEKGERTWESYSADTVHPNNTGHAIVGLLLNHYFASVYQKLDTISAEEPVMPAARYSEIYKDAVAYSSLTLTPKSLGSFAPDPESYTSIKNGWTAVGGTEPMVLEFKNCRILHLWVKRNPSPNSGSVKVFVNGVEVKTVTAAFDKNYTNPEAVEIFRSETPKDITLTITPDFTETQNTFTLLRVMQG